MSAQTINALLEKTTNWDKDERYMATSDLIAELQKDAKIDTNLERRICSAILTQLDDVNNDVQSIAVKCLSILVKKVQEQQVCDICDRLSKLIIDGKKELRDVYSNGLKTAIGVVPDHMGPTVAGKLTNRLLGGIGNDEVAEVKLECLDLMTDLLKRFGHEMDQDHSGITGACMKQLNHARRARCRQVRVHK